MNQDEIKRKHCREDDIIDPDPMSIFLGVLGALGSVASLAGYIQYERDKRRNRKYEDERDRKKRNEILDIMMALEVESLELRGLLQGLEIILIKGTDHDVQLNNLRFEFGGIHPLFTFQGYKKYDETLIVINRKCGRMIEQTSNLMQNLFYYSFDVNEETLSGLLNLNGKLNYLMRNEMNYSKAFNEFGIAIEETMKVIRNLREEIRKDNYR